MGVQLLLKGTIFGGIPFIIMSIIAYVLYLQNDFSNAKSVLCVALMALFIGFATIIYDIDQWTLIKKTIIHFLCMLVTIYPILLFSGWFPLTGLKDALIILGYFTMTGVILWLILLYLAKKFNW
ncbi:DUF3021 family protein [Weissella hellenica]|uniref:DUF3021 domain-containing protein n=1 Tax=Weissella hellenica TaxID=46256 RepID=A0A4Y4G7Z2_WEIHE|nr:DUF3021 family protein [Weissella hellenica]NKY67220.1 DUF3021 domain-containing protein [Weissella hellenica]GED36171.1 hypothetical protein WHE01_10750 [Weissella hellenica]SCC00628.1 Protein of unknown function [Weissella hellenica]